MKRFLLLLSLIGALVLTGCVSESEKTYRQATELLKQEEYHKARSSFEQLAESGYKDSQERAYLCSLEIARSDMNNQRYEAAIRALVDLRNAGYQKADALLAECYIQYGKYWASRSEYEQAIDQFNRAVAIDPAARTERGQCYYAYGVYMFSENDYAKAKELLQIAVQDGYPSAKEQILSINRQLVVEAKYYLENRQYESAYAILHPLLAQEQFSEAAAVYEQCARNMIQYYQKHFEYQKEAAIHQDMAALGYAGSAEAAQEAYFLQEAYSLFSSKKMQSAYEALCRKKTTEESEKLLIHWALQRVDYEVYEFDNGSMCYGNGSYCYTNKTEQGYLVQLKDANSKKKDAPDYFLFFIGNNQQVKLIKENVRLYSLFPYGGANIGSDMFSIISAGNVYRYGAVDGEGNIVIPCQYSDPLDFTEGYSIACLNGKYGAINPQGEVILPFVYDYLLPCTEGLFPAKYQGKYGYIDMNGQVILDFIYADAQPFSEGIAAVKEDYKYMYIDREGHALCDAVWDSLEPFSEGYGVVCRNGQYGYMRADGTLDGEVNLSYAGSYQNGLAAFRYGSTTKYLRNLSGEVLCKAEQKHITSDEYAYIYDGNVVTRSGVLLGSWFKVQSMGDGWYLVKTFGGSMGALHYERGLVIPCQWDYVGLIADSGIAEVGKSNRYGLVSLDDGSVILDPVWDDCRVLGNDLLAYKNSDNGLWGFAATNGDILSQPRWEEVGDYAEGYIAVQENGDWGFVSTDGLTVGAVIWDRVTRFSDGLAAVCMNEQWGYIDSQGEVIIPLQYSSASLFKDGIAYVGNGYIDQSGAYVIENVYEGWGSDFDENGLALIRKVKSSTNFRVYGHYDKNGNRYGVYETTYAFTDISTEEVMQRIHDRSSHLVWYYSPVKPLVIDEVLHLVNLDGEILY